MNTDRLEHFNCTQCGDCCRWPGSVLLTDADITRMAEFLQLPEEEFISGHTRLAPNRIQLALNEEPDGSCIFLKDNRCAVYGARPEQCRSFPFAWRVPRGCPALDRLSDEQINIEQAEDNP